MNSPKNLTRIQEESSSGSSYSELCLRDLSSDTSKKCSDSDCSLCAAEAKTTEPRIRSSAILLNDAMIKDGTFSEVQGNEIEITGPKRQKGRNDDVAFSKKRKPFNQKRDADLREVNCFRDEVAANVLDISDKSFSPRRCIASTSTPISGSSDDKNKRKMN